MLFIHVIQGFGYPGQFFLGQPNPMVLLLYVTGDHVSPFSCYRVGLVSLMGYHNRYNLCMSFCSSLVSAPYPIGTNIAYLTDWR